MRARVKDGGYIIDVCSCPDEPNHYFVVEDGRTVSDYDISEIELLDDEETPVQIVYDNLYIVRNDSGRLLMFPEKPIRINHIKKWDAGIEPIPLLTKFPGINLDMFKNLTWKDEPIKVRLILTYQDDNT